MSCRDNYNNYNLKIAVIILVIGQKSFVLKKFMKFELEFRTVNLISFFCLFKHHIGSFHERKTTAAGVRLRDDSAALFRG